MKATAILPVKRFGEAKRRLATGVGRERRAAIVIAMLEDVLEAIGEARSVERTIVVTSEPRAIELASAAGAEIVEDPGEGGHSGAALAGVARAAELGAECAILLPGDCPLLDPREPDRHGTGTNALVLAPPNAIAPSFGEGSRARHVAAARAADIPHSVDGLPSLALDLDTPADVIALTRAIEQDRGRGRRTAKALGI